MTLNGHFTLNFYYYDLPVSNYLSLIYCTDCLLVTSGEVHAESRIEDPEVPNIWNPWKNCGSFLDAMHRRKLDIDKPTL